MHPSRVSGIPTIQDYGHTAEESCDRAGPTGGERRQAEAPVGSDSGLLWNDDLDDRGCCVRAAAQ